MNCKITKLDRKYKHVRSKKKGEPARYSFEGKYKQICDLKKILK